MFCDTHCHLYKEYYDDLDNILKESKDNDVVKYISDGCNMETNKEMLELSSKYDNVYVTLGIHPEDIEDYKKEDLKFIEDNLNNKKVIAIGEIGLDYYWTKDNKDKQKELFEAQLKLAEKCNIPVIVHSREATQDTIDTLKKYNVKGVIHSFTGSLEVAKIYIKMGFLLGVNGVITFKNSNVKDVIKEIDVHNIILETDSPYLTPHPHRGEKNSPKYIKDIAEFVSNLYEISMEDLSKITNENIARIFDI